MEGIDLNESCRVDIADAVNGGIFVEAVPRMMAHSARFMLVLCPSLLLVKLKWQSNNFDNNSNIKTKTIPTEDNQQTIKLKDC